MAIPFEEEVPVVVFDWDGTCVVPTPEGEAAFRRAYLDDFATMVARGRDWTEGRFDELLEVARNDAGRFGWVIGGTIVAPTDVDVYVRMQVPAQMLLRELYPDKSVDDFRRDLDGLYQEHYLKCVVRLREETVEVWEALLARGISFYVVTNSDAAKVRGRLTEISPGVAERVGLKIRGLAKKFVVTEGPLCVPQHTHFGKLIRMIHLRKQWYYDVLSTILRDNKASWKSLTVIGDIAELDLALPVTMGARGLLVRGPNTPDYELAWAEQHPGAQVIENLREVLTALGC